MVDYQMKIPFFLYVFEFLLKNWLLTFLGIMYVFARFINFSNLSSTAYRSYTALHFIALPC